MITKRPTFASPQEYVAHCRAMIRSGRDPWQPSNRAELVAVVEAMPSQQWRFLPDEQTLRHIGLPAHYGRPCKPPKYITGLVEHLLSNAELVDELRKALGFYPAQRKAGAAA